MRQASGSSSHMNVPNLKCHEHFKVKSLSGAQRKQLPFDNETPRFMRKEEAKAPLAPHVYRLLQTSHGLQTGHRRKLGDPPSSSCNQASCLA